MNEKKKKIKATNLRIKKKNGKEEVTLTLSNSSIELFHSLDYNDLKSLRKLIKKKMEEISSNFFRVNEFLTLKLEKTSSRGMETNIYVAGTMFRHCKYLLINVNLDEVEKYDNIKSIDEATESLNAVSSMDEVTPSLNGVLEHTIDSSVKESKFDITPLEEFKGHSSNLQVWYENDYDTTILHSNLALPLLYALYVAGEPKAKTVFKEQMSKRLKLNEPNVVFTIIDKYLKSFKKEELEAILHDNDSLFTKLMLNLFCLEKNEYNIPKEAIKFRKRKIEFSNGMKIGRRKDYSILKKDSSLREDYTQKDFSEFRQIFIDLEEKTPAFYSFNKEQELTLDTMVIPKYKSSILAYIETIEKLLGDPTKIMCLIPNGFPNKDPFYSYREKDLQKDIVIEYSIPIVNSLKDVIESKTQWKYISKSIIANRKKGFKNMSNFLKKLLMFKILNYVIHIVIKNTFIILSSPKGINLRVIVSEYPEKPSYENVKKMVSYAQLKEKATQLVGNTLIDFGIKGIKTFPDYPERKKDLNPEDIGKCLFKSEDFKVASKCFKDKQSIKVKLPHDLFDMPYFITFRSKKERLNVMFSANEVI